MRQVGDRMIKVMVVDDSVFMRKMITKMLEKEKDIEIVAIAKNGKEAVVAALKEYIQRNKQMAIVELFGQIDYQADYDYKANRL